MGVESEDNHKTGEQGPVPSHDHLVQPSAAEQAGEQRTEGRSVTVPVVVVTQAELEALQLQLAEAQAKAKRLDERRATDRKASKQWYHKDIEHARKLSNKRTQSWRERKRQAGR